VPVTADEENGLDQDSFLMVDKITTVRRSNAHSVVGRLMAGCGRQHTSRHRLRDGGS